jgi:hypothetical protein
MGNLLWGVRYKGLLALAVPCSLAGCAKVVPETAQNDLDVRRIEQACKHVEPNAYYSVRPKNVLLKELARDQVGVGVAVGSFGVNLSFAVARTPDTQMGLLQDDQQVTAVRGWDEAAGGFDEEFVVHTGKKPLRDPSIRVDVRGEDGALGYERVHVCSLLTEKHVGLSAGEGDVTFEVTKLERKDRVVNVHVDGRAAPPPDQQACAGPHGAGVLLLPGEVATIGGAHGAVRLGTLDSRNYGPRGVGGKWQSYRYSELGAANHGALAYSAFGEVSVADPGTTIEAQRAGCLSFFVNDTDPDNNAGAFEADVAITKL